MSVDRRGAKGATDNVDSYVTFSQGWTPLLKYFHMHIGSDISDILFRVSLFPNQQEVTILWAWHDLTCDTTFAMEVHLYIACKRQGYRDFRILWA